MGGRGGGHTGPKEELSAVQRCGHRRSCQSIMQSAPLSGLLSGCLLVPIHCVVWLFARSCALCCLVVCSFLHWNSPRWAIACAESEVPSAENVM